MTAVALIVAAGSGRRMAGDVPKQFRSIAGKSVLAHAIDAMASHPGIAAVRVVVAPGQEQSATTALAGRDVGVLIPGGATRAESVTNGIAAIGESARIVLIHDAARPFCPPVVIDRLLAALDHSSGAVPVLEVTDTVARANGVISTFVERSGLKRVQTPQAFRLDDLRKALKSAGRAEATDESSVMVASGMVVAAVAGDPALEKLTTQDDFHQAQRRVEASLSVRTGLGFDVHAFAGEGPLLIGGIEIAHARGLAGHSDADVVLHSITDALLGAAALGDIGQHFPPGDPQWKGADSAIFLAHAADLVRREGGFIDHVDCTVICEAPKIGPHREAIRARVAEILSLRLGQVSIKATTTEHLGFTGRGEGIAAQALATIRIGESR